MNKNKIRIGIRLVCGWMALCLLVNFIYILLIYCGIVNDNIKSSDYWLIISSSIFTIIILSGLWHYKPWAWWLFIFGTLLSWLYTLIYIIRNYTFSMGIIFSVIGFILSAIFWFLFHPDVKYKFAIYTEKFKHIEWTVSFLFFVSFYFMALDILGGFFALFPTVVVIAAVVTIRENRNKGKQ